MASRSGTGSFSGFSTRPGEDDKLERVEGKIGSFAWFDSTRAATALIKIRTDMKEWQLSKVAAGIARLGTWWRGQEIGVDWETEVKKLDSAQDELDKCYEEVINKDIDYPVYYLEPFHAYDTGNLNWLAAKEFQPASLTVFADLFHDTPTITGDPEFRDRFGQATSESAALILSRPLKPKLVVDIGCGVCLSTQHLACQYPEAEIFGVDLSPHFLAIGLHRMKGMQACSNVKLLHAQGEKTGLPTESVDLVSLTTVMHELPLTGARAIFQEAFRLLRPDGVISFVDMDPTQSFMQYLDGYAGTFKAGIRATEPHLIEYCQIRFQDLLEECGFKNVVRVRNTTRHCVYTALVDKEGHDIDSEDSPAEEVDRTFGFERLGLVRKGILEKSGIVRSYDSGELVFGAGNEINFLYLVMEGACTVKWLREGAWGSVTDTATAGEFLGERSWSLGSSYQESAFADGPCKLLAIVPQTFGDLLSDTELTWLRQMAAQKLRTDIPEVYPTTPNSAMDSWLALFGDERLEHFPAGTKIIEKGSKGKDIYIVSSGELYAQLNGMRVMAYCRGNFFGEMAALKDTERAADIYAESDVALWVICKDEFLEAFPRLYPQAGMGL